MVLQDAALTYICLVEPTYTGYPPGAQQTYITLVMWVYYVSSTYCNPRLGDLTRYTPLRLL